MQKYLYTVVCGGDDAVRYPVTKEQAEKLKHQMELEGYDEVTIEPWKDKLQTRSVKL